MRELIGDTLKLKLDIEIIRKKLKIQDKNIELIFSNLDRLLKDHDNSEPRTQVGFKQSGKK